MTKNLNIPISFNIICLKKKNNKFINIFIYNNIYFFKLVIETKLFFINKETNNIKILTTTTHLQKDINNLSTLFYKFLKSINVYYYIKLKFKGKGYKINFYKEKKIVRFFFGKSHIQFFKINNVIPHRITKYKFLIQGVNMEKLRKASIMMMNVRKINFYTMRGVRLSKMILIKRKGRKGAWS